MAGLLFAKKVVIFGCKNTLKIRRWNWLFHPIVLSSGPLYPILSSRQISPLKTLSGLSDNLDFLSSSRKIHVSEAKPVRPMVVPSFAKATTCKLRVNSAYAKSSADKIRLPSLRLCSGQAGSFGRVYPESSRMGSAHALNWVCFCAAHFGQNIHKTLIVLALRLFGIRQIGFVLHNRAQSQRPFFLWLTCLFH